MKGLLIFFLFFSVGCQTLKGKNQAMKGWKKVDKEWLGQYAAGPASDTQRNLSHDTSYSSHLMIRSCKCTQGPIQNGRTIDINATGRVNNDDLRKKCLDESLKTYGLSGVLNTRLTVHSCSSESIAVRHIYL